MAESSASHRRRAIEPFFPLLSALQLVALTATIHAVAVGLEVRLKTQLSTLFAILGSILTAGPLGALGHAFG